MSTPTAFAQLDDIAAGRVIMIAKHGQDQIDVWEWEAKFWRAVEVAADAAASRYLTGRPKAITWTLPPFCDLAPDRVHAEAAPVLLVLSNLRADTTLGRRVRDLFGIACAEVANARDETLARLREPNPVQLLTVGGHVIERERP
jgi:hypothetical protein